MTIPELYKLYLAHPKVSKDSRENLKDAIYFSIRGDRFDGNTFAKAALKKGAAYAVVDDLSVIDPNDSRYIHVSNALNTLQELAAHHRSHFQGKVIAITGSNGKTTTKELMARILSRKYSVSATPGNYNNHIGIPLMLLQTKVDTEWVIVEMGASEIGDISSYCRIARPDYGLITNVGQAHLETFGGEEGVRQGKGELYSYISENGKRVFICADEDHLQQMAREREISNPVLYYESDLPLEDKNEFRAHLLQSNAEILFEIAEKESKSILFSSGLQGRYNFRNILSALAVGYYFDVPLKEMEAAVRTYQPISNRSEVRRIGMNEYYLDAYNANPTSMKASLQAFNASRPERKVLVIGDMLELGEYSKKAHQQLVDYVDQLSGIAEVFLVGEHFMRTQTSDRFQKYLNVDKLKLDWEKYNWQNHFIFLKGSRSIKLEKLLEK
jgi:UDP-N-acetylmuramoyl-tripeptide--D-alanyl-D-alanine ligase